jgi:hypothetical protein
MTSIIGDVTFQDRASTPPAEERVTLRARASIPPAEERVTLRARASTPPAEERVTLFFARAKKRVTRKESTSCGAPGGTVRADGKAVQMALTCSSRQYNGFRACIRTVSSVTRRRDYLPATRVPCPGLAEREDARDGRVQDAKPGAHANVLSFLVTSFFARAKKEVTRSSAGGVEAPLYNKKITVDSWCRTDEQTTTKQGRSSCGG